MRYARPDEVECGQCSRPAVSVRADWEKRYPHAEDMFRFQRSAVCAIHRGVLKRSRWEHPGGFLPLDIRPDLVALIIEQRNADYRARQKALDERSAEAAKQHAARIARDWEARAAEKPWVVEKDPDNDNYPRSRPDAVLLVIHPEGEYGWSDSFRVEASVERGGGPATVRPVNTNRLSPLAARALAEALVQAAEYAEALDAKNSPLVTVDDDPEVQQEWPYVEHGGEA